MIPSSQTLCDLCGHLRSLREPTLLGVRAEGAEFAEEVGEER
jgi:hypothetical protein